ncbi:hypothetical protein CYY_000241 [Polysphondylium violaceum]|uniref:FNIP repeat-containing protein n=1 Tax=Polysphondylium violaceum TaxID=133409 RepID=A0A8J4QBE8_9MYCE|nr:hypothetical protein CYY_000241 [Polysphondylium violaceum]
MMTKNNNMLFYSIYKNSYLRSLIRAKVLQNRVIKIPGLKSFHLFDYQYLTLLSSDDKLRNNIFVSLTIVSIEDLLDYMGNYNTNKYPYIGIVNDLAIQCYALTHFNIVVPEGIHRLHLLIDNLMDQYQLPSSLTELSFSSRNKERIVGPISSECLEGILSNLPRNLKYLTIPSSLVMSKESNKQFVLPDTLVDLNFISIFKNFNRFVVSPSTTSSNRVYKGCGVVVDNIEGLLWLQDKRWISKCILFDRPIPESVFTDKLIPSHIRVLDIHMYSKPFIWDKDCLPSGLEELRIFASDINPNSLPCGLKKLKTRSFTRPLKAGDLPKQLEGLHIGNLNHDLNVEILPGTLKRLTIDSSSQLFIPFSLPIGLQILEMPNLVDSPFAKHSLPPSLTHLILPSFQGSFHAVGPLDNLKKLSLNVMNQSVSTILANVTTIDLSFKSIDQDVNLNDPCIQRFVKKIKN